MTIFIIIKNRQYYTHNNLMVCNSCVAIIGYSLITLLTCVYGIRQDWLYNDIYCSFRAYLIDVFIVTICYSKSIHGISRLFNIVLYKHRYLTSWSIHWILILLQWIFSIIICIPIFFVQDGYQLEYQSRICLSTSKILISSIYMSTVSCFIPLILIITVHMIIFIHIQKSSRRVRPLILNIQNRLIKNLSGIQNTKREIKLMKELLIQTSILGLGGSLYLYLIISNAIEKQSPPQFLYLSSANLIVVSISTVPILQILINKQLKQRFIEIFYHRQPIVRTNRINYNH